MSDDAVAKHPGGRPSKYDPAFCERVIEFGKLGMGKCEMADELDITFNTFENWQDVHPEFLQSVKEALRRSQAWWERKGRNATFGEVANFNATSFIFNMKNRFKDDWRDKVETDINANVKVSRVERVIVDPANTDR